jgi:hypothetical protein
LIYCEPNRRVLVGGHFNSSELTPLDDVYAPELADLPGGIQRSLRAQFWSALGDASHDKKTAAARQLAASVGELIESNLDFAFDPEAIEQKARNCARVCFYITEVEAMEEFCAARGIDPPKKTASSTRRGRLLRARDPRFWRRSLDKLFGRRAENALRRAGSIHRGNQLYASDLACAQRRWKQAILDRWVKERIVTSDHGIQLNLWEVRARSQANPALRRAELMTRLRGFEEVATAAGHVADFYTLTCPSAYHRTHAHGAPNELYEGHSVRDGQGWLSKMWARARSKLKRLKVLIYGFRIAEPHHDGTVHWHMVLFCPSHHRESVRSVLRGYWLSENQFERGAQQHRLNVKDIDSHKGTAAGYLAKYVAKNIDGFEVGVDHESEITSDRDAGERSDAKQTCDRVTAWATRHGIRQFQQIGGPSVTVWRELRRIRAACPVERIESARVHADAGDFAAFIGALGGIESGRDGAVALWTEITGEINSYDEMRGPQIVGVRSYPSGKVEVIPFIKTRLSSWRIEKKGLTQGAVSVLKATIDHVATEETGADRPAAPSFSSLGPVTITVRGAPDHGAPSLWSNPNETSMYGPLH